ncbi:MAG: BMP family ABC transporter substrate-binding protein [Burkholderiales bacterium]|nr:BMP family ABC transporter substrate-binding protein [Burkholderiales bacterium]
MKRRELLAAAAGATALAGCARLEGLFTVPPERRPIAAVFPGAAEDGGFAESALRGLERIPATFGVEIRHLERVGLERERLLAAVRELAAAKPALVIVVGAETSEATQRAAWEFPEQRFAVLQGTLLRPNLAAYVVEQPQSAWLAGAAAALLTRSGTVGHVGVARDAYSAAARAAFAAGVQATDPKARLLTGFTGTPERVPAFVAALADQGADIAFAMPDAVRAGAADVARPRGLRLVGAVADWTARAPESFVAAAIADGGHAVLAAARDIHDNVFVGDLVRRFGLRVPAAVRLALAPDVPETVRARTDELGAQLVAGRIPIPERYAGPEFTPG